MTKKRNSTSLEKAYIDYAVSLKKKPDQLTDDEKRQALFNQMIEKSADLRKNKKAA